MIAVRMEGIHLASTEVSDVRVKKAPCTRFLLALATMER